MTGRNKSKRTIWRFVNGLFLAIGILAVVLPVTVSYAVAEARLRWCPAAKDKTPAIDIGKDGCSKEGVDQIPVVDDCRNALTTKRLQDAEDYFSRAARWEHTRSLLTGSDPDSLLFQNMYSVVLYKTKNKTEAKQYAEAVEGKGPVKDVGGADYTLGMLALEQGDASEAEKLLRKHLDTPNALFKQEVESTLETGIRINLPADAGDVSLTIDGKKRTLDKDGFALAFIGKHDVVLTSKRYKDFQQKVTVGQHGEAALVNLTKLQLRPITLLLTCDSPSNARFSVKAAGFSRNANGAFKSDVPEGQYTVHIEAPHYAAKDVDLTVHAGDGEVQKTYSLDPLAAFSIDTNGVDATFQLASDAAGSYSGRQNQTIQDIRPGTYQLTVTPKDKKHYRVASLKVEIEAGKPLVQPVSLKPATGSVFLTVLNATTYTVAVDGREQPADNLDLSAGEHFLTLKSRGYKDITVPVSVQPGSSVNITKEFTEPHDRTKAHALIQEGLELLVHNQKEDAQKRADDALGEDAAGPQAFGLMALIQLPDRSATEKYLNEAFKRDKNDPLALTARGSLYLNAHQFDKARSDWEQAVKADNNLEPAHALLGALYFQINKKDLESGKKEDPKLYDLAEQQLETAVSQDGKDTTALLWLGKVYVKKGKYKKAMEILTQAANMMPDPNPISVNNAKGECYAYIALATYNQDPEKNKVLATAPLELARKYRFVGVGKSGHFDLYDILKVAPPQG